jgi:thiol-disulfide isomerase/thioredoxin
MKNYILTLFILLLTIVAFGQKTFEFTVEGMSCETCAETATKVLQFDGIISASVDFATKKATVVADENMTEADIKNRMYSESNFEALFAGESLVKPLTEAEKAGLDIKSMLPGEKIKFKKEVAAGKITVFDFTAKWCGPCRIYTPKVERLLLKYPNLAVREADILEWDSDLGKQLTSEYQMPSLPFTLVFDDRGKLLGTVIGNNIEELEAIISK